MLPMKLKDSLVRSAINCIFIRLTGCPYTTCMSSVCIHTECVREPYLDVAPPIGAESARTFREQHFLRRDSK